jgi:DNA-binding transcriptional MerR regulator
MTAKYNKSKKQLKTKTQDLPELPDKLYFRIKEASQLCEVKPHVLRYWEQVFAQLTPLKVEGNRRCYQRKDILLIRRIRWLLYEEGYTIDGAKHRLNKDINRAEVDRWDHGVERQQLVAQLEYVLETLTK